MKNDTLVIVPCGQKKIWASNPRAGPTAAKNAYAGTPFGINRKYAEKFGDLWLILSAKYGFIEPTFQIPGPYNVTFKTKSTGPISTNQLHEQVRRQQLDRFSVVIALGGKEYRHAIECAYDGSGVQLEFPFSGLKIGKMMQATNRAIDADNPLLKS